MLHTLTHTVLLLATLGAGLTAQHGPRPGDEGEVADTDYDTGVVVLGVWAAFVGVMLITGTVMEMYGVYRAKNTRQGDTTQL